MPNDPAAFDYADMVISAEPVVAVAEQLASFEIFTRLMRLVSYMISMMPMDADRSTGLIAKYETSIQCKLRGLLGSRRDGKRVSPTHVSRHPQANRHNFSCPRRCSLWRIRNAESRFCMCLPPAMPEGQKTHRPQNSL